MSMWSHHSNSSGPTLAAQQSKSGLKTALMVWKCIQVVALHTGYDHIWFTEVHPASNQISLLSRIQTAKVSEVLLSMDWPPGTVCRLHYEHQSCHNTFIHALTDTCSHPPGTVETFYAIPTQSINTLTYLLIYWSNAAGGERLTLLPHRWYIKRAALLGRHNSSLLMSFILLIKKYTINKKFYKTVHTHE